MDISRVVEAYVGEYASGKSEVALNRALALLKEGRRPVTLVDFDLVEPFYTLRPIKEELKQKGLEVIAWDTRETVGLGEAGSLIKPEMRWVMKREGDVILDVGYGIAGARKLGLVEGALEGNELQIYVVVNIARPITGSMQDIVEYVNSLGPVHGLINNSHLGDDTDIEVIEEGAKVISEAAHRLNLPVMWTSAETKFRTNLGERDSVGNPVRYVERYMHRTFW
ncbi:MAG: hypothetical protein RBT41_11655 [Clostridia bacterium]|jgi:hypothetical protein|nr:hypothetical protein [Clostridia bacterium]